MSNQEPIVSQEELEEADELLRGIEIHAPHNVLSPSDGGFKQTTEAWIKISTSFKKIIGRLKGSKLAVFLFIGLCIDEHCESFPSIDTISREIKYSRREVISAIGELQKAGYLTIARGKRKSNLYHVNVGMAYGKGNDPKVIGAENAPVQFGTLKNAPNCTINPQNTRQNAPKQEEPLKQEPSLGKEIYPRTDAKKKGDILDGILAFAPKTADSLYPFRESIPEPLLPLSDEYVRVSGEQPKSARGNGKHPKIDSEWIIALQDWQTAGVTVPDIQAAWEYANRPGGFLVASIRSLTKTVCALARRRKSGQPLLQDRQSSPAHPPQKILSSEEADAEFRRMNPHIKLFDQENKTP